MLSVEIITPQRLVQKSKGDLLIVPTTTGVLGIRSGHLPLVATLKAGEIEIRSDDQEESEFLVVSGGFLEIINDHVRILADSAERADELDEIAIKEAIERARRLKEDTKDRHQLGEATVLIEMNLARLKVAQKRRKY